MHCRCEEFIQIVKVQLTCWHLNNLVSVSQHVAIKSRSFSMHFFSDSIHSVCAIAATQTCEWNTLMTFSSFAKLNIHKQTSDNDSWWRTANVLFGCTESCLKSFGMWPSTGTASARCGELLRNPTRADVEISKTSCGVPDRFELSTMKSKRSDKNWRGRRRVQPGFAAYNRK